MGFTFSSIQKDKGALLKDDALPTVFLQRGGVRHIHTEMCFGLRIERFAIGNTGSLRCLSALQLWAEVLKLGAVVQLGAAVFVVCSFCCAHSLCYKVSHCWKSACLSLFFHILTCSVSFRSSATNPQISPYAVELC